MFVLFHFSDQYDTSFSSWSLSSFQLIKKVNEKSGSNSINWEVLEILDDGIVIEVEKYQKIKVPVFDYKGEFAPPIELHERKENGYAYFSYSGLHTPYHAFCLLTIEAFNSNLKSFFASEKYPFDNSWIKGWMNGFVLNSYLPEADLNREDAINVLQSIRLNANRKSLSDIPSNLEVVIDLLKSGKTKIPYDEEFIFNLYAPNMFEEEELRNYQEVKEIFHYCLKIREQCKRYNESLGYLFINLTKIKKRVCRYQELVNSLSVDALSRKSDCTCAVYRLVYESVFEGLLDLPDTKKIVITAKLIASESNELYKLKYTEEYVEYDESDQSTERYTESYFGDAECKEYYEKALNEGHPLASRMDKILQGTND